MSKILSIWISISLFAMPHIAISNSPPKIIGCLDAGGFANETFTWNYSYYVVGDSKIHASSDDPRHIKWDGLTAIINYTMPGDYYVNLTFSSPSGDSVTQRARIRIVEKTEWNYAKVIWAYGIRQDGWNGRINAKKTEDAIKDMNANTFVFFCEYGEYKYLEGFLKNTTIDVCAEISLGEETNQPFGNDFEKWAEWFANLSLKYPNLKAFTIDDLHPELNSQFTPSYLERVIQAKNRINPNLKFLPTLYFDSDELKYLMEGNPYKKVFRDGAFMWYWASINGNADLKELQRYIEISSKTDVPIIVGIYPIAFHSDFDKFYSKEILQEMLNVAMQLDGIALFQPPIWVYDLNYLYNGTVFKQVRNDDSNFDFKLGLPPGEWLTLFGWYQSVYANISGIENASISFKIRDDIGKSGYEGYYFKQLVVNKNILWEEDVGKDGKGAMEIKRNIPSNANVSIRLLSKNSAWWFGANVYVGNIKIFSNGKEINCNWTFKSGIDCIDEYMQLYNTIKDVFFSHHNAYVYISKPKDGYLYIFDREIIPVKNTIIIGKITIEAVAHADDGIDKVEFYIDGNLKSIDYDEPYQWLWNDFAIGKHEIEVKAFSRDGKCSDKLTAFAFIL